jgi:hypothetical protein
MNKKRLTIKNPFELHYDPVSRQLTLTKYQWITADLSWRSMRQQQGLYGIAW